MTTHRIALALITGGLLAVFALPAAAQIPHCNEPLPPGVQPRAGFTCSPTAGGGMYTQTTCTFFGDIEWLIELMNTQGGAVHVPAGTCGLTLDLGGTDWYLVPGWVADPVSGDIWTSPCLYDIHQQPDVTFLACNAGIPLTSTGGLMTLIVVLAALGAFVLWRRTV